MGNGTSIGRVRGLGASHSGAHHWLMERLSGLASLVTSVYLIVSLLMLPNLSYMSVHDWIAHPVSATAATLFVIVNFWHARMGLQVVIEDYAHVPATKLAALVALNFVAYAGAGFAVLCILRIAFGAA